MKKLTNTKKARGFTIVELLVVIVVIGILAAISIVSYAGVTSKAKGEAGKSNATAVINAAEMYFAEKNSYPTLGNLNSGTYAKYSTSINVTSTTPADGNAPTDIYYVLCGTTGAKAGFWDYSLSTPAAGYIKTGTGC